MATLGERVVVRGTEHLRQPLYPPCPNATRRTGRFLRTLLKGYHPDPLKVDARIRSCKVNCNLPSQGPVSPHWALTLGIGVQVGRAEEEDASHLC